MYAYRQVDLPCLYNDCSASGQTFLYVCDTVWYAANSSCGTILFRSSFLTPSPFIRYIPIILGRTLFQRGVSYRSDISRKHWYFFICYSLSSPLTSDVHYLNDYCCSNEVPYCELDSVTNPTLGAAYPGRLRCGHANLTEPLLALSYTSIGAFPTNDLTALPFPEISDHPVTGHSFNLTITNQGNGFLKVCSFN